MNVATYYLTLAEQRRQITQEGIDDGEVFSKHTISHSYIAEFSSIGTTISNESKSVFEQGCREFQYSLEAVSVGNYRHAFSSLRLSFELLIGSVYFSAHLLKLKLWLNGNEDLFWSVLNDSDHGVYSHNFVRAFFPELGPHRTQYMNLAGTVYRECSEYVHGNPGTHENTEVGKSYDRDKALEFHDKAETIRMCIIFAFVIRYLTAIEPEGLKQVEGIVLDAFGDLVEVQAIFAKE